MPRLLLIISQVYEPDPAAVGQQIADVAAAMVHRGWRVVVYTSNRGYDDPSKKYRRREIIEGVEVRRLPFSSFGKRSIPVRLAAQVLFIAQAIMHGAMLGGLQAVLVSTSPPFAGFAGLALGLIRRVPYVWWVMDLNPDQLVTSGAVREKSTYVWLFRMLNRLTLRQARAVITLDRFMASRLASYGMPLGGVQVIPPWAKTQVGCVSQREAEHFRRTHGLQSKFVVMYSGNHALQHPLTTLLEAAERLQDDPNIVFLFVGAGVGKAEVEARMQAGAKNLVSLPFQPAGELRTSLGAADLHVVSMGDDLVGIVHPCKIYGAMAVGRPILFFGPAVSHVGEIVAEHGIGWRVSHGDAFSAADIISDAAAAEASVMVSCGRRASEVINWSYCPRMLKNKVCNAIERACVRR